MRNVRDARPDDYDAYVRLFPELDVDEATPSRERFADDLASRMLVVDDTDAITGYLLYELFDDTGYVRNIVTDPARRRSGVGRLLMDTVRARFIARGASRWCLNVKEANRPAIALYEQVGMRLQYRTTAFRVPRATALPPPAAAYALVPVSPATDGEIERRFVLLPGQLASARRKPGRDVLQLVCGDAVVGVGVFMSSIPGAFPFRVDDPDHAAAFLALLRTRVTNDLPWLQAAVEDDAALAARLAQLGAKIHLELLHLHGPLA